MAKNKSFDCVEMKREVQAKLYEQEQKIGIRAFLQQVNDQWRANPANASHLNKLQPLPRDRFVSEPYSGIVAEQKNPYGSKQ